MRKIMANTNNVYMKARLKASECNDRLRSRKETGEILGVSESQMSNYENNLCKQIPPDVVVKMAELYNAPELMYYYCNNECPIGRCIAPNVELPEIPYLVMQLSVLSKNPETFVQELIKIFQDGVVSKDEEQDFVTIVKSLVEFSEKIQSLDLWSKKNLK